jgi:tRNA-specific 2-thiouridylase
MNKPDLRKFAGARVVVAMSGGVDSSVAAALLAAAGCEVIGVTMKLWDPAELGDHADNDARCCSADALCDARMVACQRSFPFHIVDLADDFRREVITDFIEEYQAGRTPNPCVVCNTKIKWSALEARAEEMNADFLATGHYARIDYTTDRGQLRLLRGIDDHRDQSYFLWGVSPASLGRTIFPLGGLTKDNVRIIARELGLRNAERPESREICFVTDDDYGRFLRERAGVIETPGNIVNHDGKTVGRHHGIAFYTIGQRKGIGAHGEPAYVTALDVQSNIVFIGTDDQLWQREFMVDDINWISIDPPQEPISALVKIRYRHQAAPARLSYQNNVAHVMFESPQRAITPGQSAVFYDGDIVLGGGRIKQVIKNI